ncbi:MAG: hypothetical protein HY261_09115 [Chloroflexi bacterium]|nr:hypothetical protein [Chloroflexota bacterium]
MPSHTIDEFVENRWRDAKTELRGLDPLYVQRVEKKAFSDPDPLMTDADISPATRLSKEWHQLLEACYELALRQDLLRFASIALTAHNQPPPVASQAGKASTYHFRSWFAHALALAEQANYVGVSSERVYLSSGKKKAGPSDRLKARISGLVTTRVEQHRNDYLHGGRSSWANGITEDGLWELGVSVNMTPSLHLEQFVYDRQGLEFLLGKQRPFVQVTEEVLARLGDALHDFEVDLTLPCNSVGT